MPQNFKFNEEQNLNQFRGRSRQQKPFLVRLVFKLSGGRIKSEKQANWVLLGVVVLLVFVAFIFPIFFGQNKMAGSEGNYNELKENYPQVFQN